MKVVDLTVTDRYRVRSHGNGLMYELRCGDRSTLLQGDDAQLWRQEFDLMVRASNTEGTVWYEKTWNECLSHVIDDYL